MALFVSDVVQNAWIETSEEGTQAAAATAVVLGYKSSRIVQLPPPPVIFHADHPFLYLIRDVESGVILFMGRMVKTPDAVD